jgi:hypothetical protein
VPNENFTSVCAVTDLSGIAILCVKHIPREKVILMTDVGLLFGGEASLQALGIDCPVALRANRSRTSHRYCGDEETEWVLHSSKCSHLS